MHLNSASPGFFAGTPPFLHGNAARPDTRLEGIDLNTPMLVVEDEAMIAWMIESLLKDMGFASVAIAGTGQQAILLAEDMPPGLIVTDINLGTGIDGIAAAAAIRTARAVPVIFITGHASEEAHARIESDVPGAAVLRKPVLEAELRTAVAQALGPGVAS